MASSRWFRLARLVLLLDARQQTLFGMRVARWFGGAIALGYAIAMLVLATSGAAVVADVLVVRALGWLSWLAAGAAALSAARDLAALDTQQGMVALAAQRGFSGYLLEPARTAAAAYAITRVLAIPALALALLALALSPGIGLIGPRVVLCAAVLAYSALLGVTLALLARWSSALSPRHGRSVMLGLVFLPELAAAALGDVPSVPSAFADLLDAAQGIGATLP